MAVPISNVVRRIVFAPSGTGPYAFTFEILAATDIEVYKGDTLLTLTTDYTVTINPNGTGSVTLVATAGTDNITIVGARTIQRTTDFVTGGDLFANSLNDELDSLTIFIQQNAEAGDRAIRAPVTDPTTIDMTLPTKTDRAGKYLSFNASTGDPEVVNNVVDITAVAANATNINTVAGQISPVNNISTVAGVAANITTVAGIAANVTTVAGISSNVTTVAGISADVTAVAGDATDIGLVAAVSTDVAALGPIAADITTVAGIDSDVTAVAADATDIGTVASNIANVNTVAGIDADVTTVAGISADVTAVAGDATDIGTVAGIAANVTTVAGIAANVTTVAGISSDVTTVAGDSADIQLLAANIGTIASKANAGANSDITSLSGLTTPLSVPQGGTGASTLTAENVILGDGTNPVKFVAPGSNGNVLTSNGTTWTSAAPTGGTSDKIEEGNSSVEVVDAGTGKIEFTVDAVEVADFTAAEVVFNETGANQDFRVEGDADANLLFVDASADRIGIGTSSPGAKVEISRNQNNSTNGLALTNLAGSGYGSSIDWNLDSSFGIRIMGEASAADTTELKFSTKVGGTVAERMRITSAGEFVVGKTTTSFSTAGSILYPDGRGYFTVNADDCIAVNRLGNDGNLIRFFQATTEEGNISVSGSTVSYNGGHLSRWAQLTTPKDDTPLFKGTVMSNLDEMNVYIAPTTYWTEEDELPVDEEGNPTAAVGDVKVETHEVQNEQLNKVKVSDVEGDDNVAGVFVSWDYDEAHQVDEINMAMTGDMIIRIAEGVTVARGDLLMSAGDGTAKPQGDDIVRSKTIAKVTSTHITCTYDDGSYCVPCVLMAC